MENVEGGGRKKLGRQNCSAVNGTLYDTDAVQSPLPAYYVPSNVRPKIKYVPASVKFEKSKQLRLETCPWYRNKGKKYGNIRDT